MRNLIGLEMVCFGQTENFELRYEAGAYMDPEGEVVQDLLDMCCYVCSASFYTRSGESIPYCPNCGHIDRKHFEQREDLVSFLQGNDLSWTGAAGLEPMTVLTFEGGWELRIVKKGTQLQASGRYREVRQL